MPRKKVPQPRRPHRHAIGSSVMDGNGHVTALSPAVHKRLITELEVGDFPAMAAIRAGCSPTTVDRWVVWGCDPHAVEPYKSFASDFVRVEASICGALTAVVMDHALGRTKSRAKNPRPKGDPLWAMKLLENRFRFLWHIGKDGQQGGVSVAQMVVSAIAAHDHARAEKAREILKQLSEPAKQEARKAGFLV